MNKVHSKRLLNVAKALRESPRPMMFSMRRFVHSCGTPMCALGHYAQRLDLQRTFRLSNRCLMANGSVADFDGDEVKAHFGIKYDDAEKLFDAWGCNRAQTNIQAAEYIEDFVANH